MGSVGMITMSITARAVAARILLDSEDLRNVLDDQEFIRTFESRGQRFQHFPWKFGACLVGFGGMLLKLPADSIMMITYLAPWLAVRGVMGVPANLVLESLVDLSRHKVETLCSKLEPRSESEQSAQVSYSALLRCRGCTDGCMPRGVDDKMKESSFWCNLTQEYVAMDEQLEKLWSLRYGGALLFADCMVRCSLAMILVCGAAGAEQKMVLAFCVAGAAATVITLSMNILPLAQVTALCQSQRANKRSVIRLAAKFVNHNDLTHEAQASHSRFLQYVRGTPAGIEVPLLGLLTERSLMAYIKATVTIAPVALAYLLRALGRNMAMPLIL